MCDKNPEKECARCLCAFITLFSRFVEIRLFYDTVFFHLLVFYITLIKCLSFIIAIFYLTVGGLISIL